MAEEKTEGANDPQNQPEKFIAPMAQDPAKAAAEAVAKAAMEAALQAASQAATNPTLFPQNSLTGRGELRINSQSTRRRRRRNTQNPFAWLQSPGTFIWGVTSGWLLEDNAKARGLKGRDAIVEKIRCAHYDNDSRIFIWVTNPLDADGIRVKLVNGRYQANIADWMFEEGIAPEPGISQKFDLVEAPELMLGLPSLCIDLNKAQQTSYFATTKEKDEDENEEGETKGKVDKKDPDPDTDDESE